MTSHHLGRIVLALGLGVPAAGAAFGVAFGAAAGLTVVAAADPMPSGPGTIHSVHVVTDTVYEVKQIGTSVQGRPIRAYHLGSPDARTTAVVLGSMHGNEQAGMSVVDALRDGKQVTDVDLWVIPTINPDGVAANDRQNAHGVDLNRNFPHDWAALTGEYYSGPKPLSEPESRALKRFLNRVDPKFMVSFHQPLGGVGRAGERRPFLRRLSKGLDLPIKAFNCTGECHGTMTSWFMATHNGTAVTVEFGSSPTRKYCAARLPAARWPPFSAIVEPMPQLLPGESFPGPRTARRAVLGANGRD